MRAERIALAALPAQPWKNGAGLTREIAARPAPGGGFDWRLSLASVDQDGPFSAYPGIDRVIVLVGGDGLHLRSNDGAIDHRLAAVGTPFAFAGEHALHARLLGSATIDFNAMTRRGAWHANARPLHAETPLGVADARLVLPLRGRWQVDGEAVAVDHALLWRDGAGPATAAFAARTTEPATLLVVDLTRSTPR